MFRELDPLHSADLGLEADPGLVKRVKDSDLLVFCGRLGEIPPQSYRRLEIPQPGMSFAHVYPEPKKLGAV